MWNHSSQYDTVIVSKDYSLTEIQVKNFPVFFTFPASYDHFLQKTTKKCFGESQEEKYNSMITVLTF